jgi:hypothetical protein
MANQLYVNTGNDDVFFDENCSRVDWRREGF